ncbi:hypothetical protein DTL21_04560 [Bremerella cremea]|uniref:Leucine-rich repeat domain-containing protein n=1 Tax=Blastopirellula marina TaxID=124 RepID=A0A2S8FYF6_9BACT|nr:MULTISPECIES: hypothetical protein [Pirellulaceae]PQO37225.1 hypothetical protein C5Y83_04560 [Blastopirellula marina]RCS49612.1 hypothetical protein DTL21_04560 [Bremerella cremea]
MPRFLRQFGLRTLLLFCFVAAVCFGLLRWRMDRIHRQHAVAKELLERNARIQWQTSGPKWLRDVVGAYYFTELVMVDLQMRGQQDQELSLLGDLPALERLYLAGNPLISDQGLDHLRELKHIRRLSLWGTGVTDNGLSKLSHFDALEALDLKDTQVTQAGLARLSPLPKLKELYHRFEFTDEGLQAVAQLPTVYFGELQVGEISQRGFAQLPKIRFSKITLQNANVTDWPWYLYDHPTMSQIELHRVEITDEQAKQLIATNDLHYVILNDVPVSDEILPALVALGNGLTLRLKGTKISANGFLKHLGDRQPGRMHISDEIISMSSMGIPGMYLSYTGQVPLHDLPGLANLHDVGFLSIETSYPKIDLSHLPPLPSLELIVLDVPINDTALARLAPQLGLKTIIVSAGDQFTPTGLQALKDCRSLEELLLVEDARMTDEHLAAISECRQLRSLAIHSHGEITPQGIACLADMPRLTMLTIAFEDQIENDVLAEAAQLKKLEELTIIESDFMDENVPSLVGMTNLKELTIYHSRMSPAANERLRKALPGVKMEVFDR